MTNLSVTTFHIDFSTLDIEKGSKALAPFDISYTIQPTLKVEGLVLEKEEPFRPEEEVSAPERRKRRR